MRGLLSRIQKLEMQYNKTQLPGLFLLFRQPDNSLINNEGEPVPDDTDYAGALVIIYTLPGSYKEITGDEFAGAQGVVSFPQQYATCEEWETAAKKQQAQ